MSDSMTISERDAIVKDRKQLKKLLSKIQKDFGGNMKCDEVPLLIHTKQSGKRVKRWSAACVVLGYNLSQVFDLKR